MVIQSIQIQKRLKHSQHPITGITAATVITLFLLWLPIHPLVSEGGNSDEHLLLHQRQLDMNADSLEGLDDEDVEAHIQSMNGFSSSSERDHSHHRSHHQKGSSHSSHHSKRGRHSKKSREGEIGCCMKYTLFGVNTIAWIFGFVIMMIGIWAWNEKDYLSNLTNIPLITLDPAFALIVIGLISFVIGFTGCIGALRENTCLLATYSVFLISILVLELSLSVLAFILKDWVSSRLLIGDDTNTSICLSDSLFSRSDLKHHRRCKHSLSTTETTLIDRT